MKSLAVNPIRNQQIKLYLITIFVFLSFLVATDPALAITTNELIKTTNNLNLEEFNQAILCGKYCEII